MDSKNNKLIYFLLSLNLGKLTSFAGAFILTTSALANPVLNNVGAGSVNFQRSPNTLTIQQNSPQAILNWNSFNIGSQERTSFIQPAGGIALNRISPTQGPSSIYGVLTATGQIILVNPAGIYFGPSSVVNVGGLIATTANITNRDFLNRNYVFTNAGPGSIVNAGTIVARNHGLVALVGSNVTNSGHIQANLGHVVLATGEAFTVNFAGNHLINFKIGGKAGKVTNTGSLIANGGQVMVTAAAARNVLDNVINMQGVAQAKSVYKKGGEIIISGDPNGGVVKVASKMVASGKAKGQKGGKVKVNGYDLQFEMPTIIDASGDIGGGLIQIGKDDAGKLAHSTTIKPDVILAANSISSGNGGFIETSGEALDINGININLKGAGKGTTGTWLLDPADLTICAACVTNAGFAANTYSPGAGNSNLFVNDLTTALSSANVVVQTTSSGSGGNGDIFISTPINWNSANTLTLTAFRNITPTVPLSITNAGNGGLVLTSNNTLAGTGTIGLNGNITMSGLGNITLNGPVQLSANSALSVKSGNILFNNSNVNIALGGNTLTLASTNNSFTQTATVNSSISGSGGLTMTGNLNTYLNNASPSYTGTTNIGDGLGTTVSTLIVKNANSLGTSSLAPININNNSNLVFDIAGTPVFGNSSLITMNNYTWLSSEPSSTSNLTLNNPISVTGGNNNAIFTNWVNNGSNQATLTLGGDITVSPTAADLQFAAKGISDVINVTGDILSTLPTNIQIGCAVGLGCGGFYNDGKVIFSGANTYLGNTTINSGELKLAANNTLPTATTVHFTALGFGTLNVNGFTQTINNITEQFIDVGDEINLGNGTLTLSNAVGTVGTYYYGSGILNKEGVGNYTLDNINGAGYLDFIGTTNIKAGTLTLSNNAGATSDIDVFGGATLAVTTPNVWIGALSGAGSVTLPAGGSFSLGNSNSNGNFSGSISGAANVFKDGTGTQTFSGSNTYSGSTTIDSGVLSIGSINALGIGGMAANNTSAVSVLNGGVLDFSYATGVLANNVATITLNGSGTGNGALTFTGSAPEVSRPITLGSNTTIGGSGNGYLYGQISGAFSLTKAGSGNLTLTSRTSNYSGDTSITGGSLTADYVQDNGTVSNIGIGSNLNISNGAIFKFASTDFGYTTTRNINIGTGGGTIQLTQPTQNLTLRGTVNNAGNPLTLDVMNSNTLIVNFSVANPATIINSGSLSIKSTGTGTGTVFFGSNGYISGSGPINIDSGTLQFGGTSGNHISNTSDVTVNSGGTFRLDSSQTIKSLAGAGNVTFFSNSVLNNSGSVSTNFSGSMSGAGGLTKSGTGTLTLSGSNSYTGATNITGGILSLASSGALGNGVNNTSGVVVNGGELDLNGAALIAEPSLSLSGSGVGSNGALYAASGVNSYTGPISLTGAATIGVNAGSSLTLGDITNTASRALTLAGTGLMTLDGDIGAIGGGNVALASLTANGTLSKLTLGGPPISITTTGAQTYNAPVAIDGDLTLTSTGSGNITFANTVDLLGASPAYALNINTSGNTIFSNTVGATNPIGSITTDAGTGGFTQVNGGIFRTTGAQTYNDPFSFNTDTTLTSTNSGDITFNSTVDPSGNRTLAINTSGNTIFNSNVGSNGIITGLVTDAGGSTIINTPPSSLPAIITIGPQTYNDKLLLGADTELRAFDLDATTLGDISFNGGIDSSGANHSLAFLVAHDITFGGMTGNVLPLSSISVGAFVSGTLFFNGSLIKTTGTQDYQNGFFGGNQNIILGANTTLTSTGGGVSLYSALDPDVPGRTLTISAPGGILLSRIGTSIAPIGALSLDASSSGVVFNGDVYAASLNLNSTTGGHVLNGSVTTTGDQTWGNGQINLSSNDVSLTAGGNITGAALNGNNRALIIDVAGSASSFSGQLSNFTNFTKTGIGTLTLSGGNAFSSPVNILNGTLVANNLFALGTGVINITPIAGVTAILDVSSQSQIFNSNTINFNSSPAGSIAQLTTGNISLPNPMAFLSSSTANRVSAASGTTTTLTGQLTGNGGLTVSGPGTLVISNPNDSFPAFRNTYSGGTILNGAGTLAVAHNNDLGTGTLTYQNGTFATTGVNLNIGNNILLQNTIQLGGSNDFTLSGIISESGGSRGLTKNSTNKLTLANGNNSYSGRTTINGGILSINSIANLNSNSAVGNPTTVANGTIDISGNGTLLFTGTNASSNRVINLTGSGATIDSSGFGALTLTGGVTSAAPGFGLVLTGFGIGTVSGNITTGLGATVTKDSTSTWTLSGTNTYTGGTNINQGTLVAGSAQALGTSGSISLAPTLFNSAILDVSGLSSLTNNSSINMDSSPFFSTVQLTTGNTSLSNPIGLTGSTNNINVLFNRTTTLTGQISGSGSLSPTGFGTLIINNTLPNAYSGGTRLNSSGILAIATSTALGTGALNYFNGTFTVNTAGLNVLNDIVLNNNILLDGSNNYTLGGVISENGGSFGVTKNGLFDLTLANANTYSGTTTINKGRINLGANDAIPLFSNLVFANDATAILDLGSYGVQIGTLSGGGVNGGTIVFSDGNAAVMTINQNTDTTFSGYITGNGNYLAIDGPGILTLDGSVSANFSDDPGAGVLIQDNGHVRLGKDYVFNGTNHFNIGADSILDLNNFSETIQGLDGVNTTGEVRLGNAGGNMLTMDTNNGFVHQFRGSISGAGDIEKKGTDEQDLWGNNTYTGKTFVRNGQLGFRADTFGLGSTSEVQVFSGGTLEFDFDGNVASTAPIILNGTGYNNLGALYTDFGDVTINSNITLASDSLINTPRTLYLNGVIGGAGGLIVGGNGTVELDQVNNYSGSTTINDGMLRLGIANATPSSTDLTIGATGAATFNLNNFSTSIRNLMANPNAATIDTGNGTTGVLAINQTSDQTFSGLFTGNGRFAKNGSGNLTLTGNNTIGDSSSAISAILNAGTLTLGHNNALGIGKLFYNGGILAANTNLVVPNSIDLNGEFTLDTITNDVTLNGIIDDLSNNHSVSKIGTGTLFLTNNNTYTGGTNVSAGILEADNANALGTSGVIAVTSGATLRLNIAAALANNSALILDGTGVGNVGALYNVDTTGTTSLTNAIQLVNGSAASITTNAGSILALNGSIDNAADLSLAGPGAITVGGAIGNNSALQSLDVNSNIFNFILGAGVVKTIGAQNYNPATVLGANSALTSTGGAINFNNTLDGTFNLALASSSGSTFNGAVGSGVSTPLNSLNVTLGSLTVNGGLIRTVNSQNYADNVSLGADAAFTTTASSGNVVLAFNGISGNQNATLNSAAGAHEFFSLAGNLNTNNIIVNGAGPGVNNTLTVNAGGTPTWNILSGNTGNITGVAGVAGTFVFNAVGNLVGGANADTFDLSGGTLNGTINGAGGINTLNGNNLASTWNITGANAGNVTGIAGFSNIAHLIGDTADDNFTLSGGSLSGSINGGTGVNQLTGNNVANTWVITSADGGSVNGIGGGFSNIGNLVGGSSTDNFTLTNTLSGNLNGGGGNNTLFADNVANTWNITGANKGSVTKVSGLFSNINNLVGGASTDKFTLKGGSVSGNISGGGGSNTLTANNSKNIWNISGADMGKVTSVGGFKQIQHLVGGTGGNDFIFANNAKISGSIDGGSLSQLNTLNFTSYTSPVTVNMPTIIYNGTAQYANGVIANYTDINNLVADPNLLNLFTIPAGKPVYIVATLNATLGTRQGWIDDPTFFYGFFYPLATVAAPIVVNPSPIIQQPDIYESGLYESNAVWVYQDEMNIENINDINASWSRTDELMKVKIDPYCSAEGVESISGSEKDSGKKKLSSL